MAQPFTISLPGGRILSDGDVIRIGAINATTGAAVSGVVVNNAILEFELVSGAASDLVFGPFLLVPGPSA